MGSRLDITVHHPEPLQCRAALAAACAEADRLEMRLSPFLPQSELSNINRFAAHGPVIVGPELIDLLRQSLAVARLTAGAFDVTVAPLMALWGFRRQTDAFTAPPEDRIKTALRTVGYRHVCFDEERGTVAYRTAGVQIEFGAIGKGYAIDRIVTILKQHGVTTALVSFGSTAYGLGAPPKQDGWRVAIRHPRDPERSIGVVVLTDRALSTSGDYEQCLWLNGRRFSHLLDPRNGHPVDGMASVSVVAQTAAASDALSTAAFVLGPMAGLQTLESHADMQGLMVTEEQDGALVSSRTSGWDAFCHAHRSGSLLDRRRFLAACLAVAGWLLVPSLPSEAIIYLTREEALKKLMPHADTIEEQTVTLSPDQKQAVEQLVGGQIREERYAFGIGKQGDVPIGYAVLLDIIGKERPITFMVAVSAGGEVMGIEVLLYRESRGSEIRSGRFMQQFIGKTAAAPLKLGRDVDAISGATLSSRATAYAVKKALVLVEVIYTHGKMAAP